MRRITFETINVPAMYAALQAVFSLYAPGRTARIVAAVGDAAPHVVPISAGFALSRAILRLGLVGDFALGFDTEAKAAIGSSDKMNPHELPDVDIIALEGERLQSPAVLSQPSFIGKAATGSPDIALDGNIITVESERLRSPVVSFQAQLHREGGH